MTARNNELNTITGVVVAIMLISALGTAYITQSSPELHFMTVLKIMFLSVVACLLYAATIIFIPSTRIFISSITGVFLAISWWIWWPVTLTKALVPPPEHQMVFSYEHAPIEPSWLGALHYLPAIIFVVGGFMIQFKPWKI